MLLNATSLATPLPLTRTLSASLPVGLALVVLAGLLLLAMALGALWGRTTRPTAPPVSPSRTLDDVLTALPFPAGVVQADGTLVVLNAHAAHWLDDSARLAQPLTTLARRASASGNTESAQVTLAGGQKPQRVQANPLANANNVYGVLLVAPPGTDDSPLNLTRLVAHELRTPLTAIVGHAEILASCAPSDEALWRRSRDFIATAAQRLARLVDDLLALSRLEAAPPFLQTVNLRAVVEGALSSLYDRGESAGLALQLAAPPNLPRVRADPHRLEQALVNLLDNAIKYAPGGARTGGNVTARLVSEGGYVRVEIADTGPGISPEDLPHLFEPLYRAHGVRHLPGTGLGLTIVRAILEQHGASISVRSKPGQGATFTFRLPVAA